MDELIEVLGYPVAQVPPPACRSREHALAFLVGFLARTGQLGEADTPVVLARVAAREAVSPTVLGKGFALPHILTPAVEQVTGVSGRAGAPIPWPGGYDGAPVRYVTLLLVPASRPQELLLAEEGVVRKMFRSGHAGEQAVRLRAYRLWEAAGRPEGRAEHFWYKAERDLLADR